MKWPKLVRKIAFNIVWIIGYITVKFLFRVKVEGVDNIPNEGSYLLVANHQSYIDPVAVHTVSRRQLNYLIDAEWYYDWRWKWFYDLFGCIPIEERKANIKAIERAIHIILKGEPLVIFPEGGISRDGKLRNWLPGVGLIALKTGVPIIPVLIKGTRDVLPFNRSYPRIRPVNVYAGKPIVLEPIEGIVPRDEINKATNHIKQALLQLAEEKNIYEEIT